MGLGDPTIYVYQFKFDKEDSDYTHIIQYFVMYGLGLCIKLDSYVAYMFYAYRPSSHNAEVPIAKKNRTNIIFL